MSQNFLNPTKSFLYGLLASTVIGGALLAGAANDAALAGPGKINGPHVEKGEIEVEVTGTYGFDYDTADDAFENEFEFEYGLTDSILFEAGFEVEKENDENTDIGGFGFGFRYEIAEPGELWVDTAVELGYEFSGTGGADELGLEVLLQKNIGAYTLRSNIGFEYEIGEESEDGLGFEVAFGAYRPIFDHYEIGVEYFGEVGNLTEQSGYSAQEHFIGPVVGSEIHLNDDLAFGYKIGYFQGISAEATDGTLKYEIEFEF